MTKANASAALAPEILPAGTDAIVVRFGLRPEVPAIAAAQIFAAALDADPPEGLRELAPALVSVRVSFDPTRTQRATLAQVLQQRAMAVAAAPATLPDPVRRWTIPAAFGGDCGPHLSEVAALTGLSEAATVDAICAADLRVLAIGFAPGQPYIGLLPPEWDFPRMAALTPSVPAGAIVVAVRQIVMFGAPSPTGWRQVACAAFRTFLPDRAEPMPLRSGDAIRYAQAPADEIAGLRDAPDELGGARLDILR